MRLRLLAVLCTALLAPFPAFADDHGVKAGHPDEYVVVKGDTLWDISGRFLERPWLWPEIWQVNPQIENPHLIYPGDVITLTWVDGKPRLGVKRGRDVKLSPTVRATPIDRAIPTIPIDAIQQFLDRTRMVGDDETLKSAPYVVAFADEHISGGAGDRVYARGIAATPPGRYILVRPGKPYVHPVTEEVLGHEALYLGHADLERAGDPATLKLTRSAREVVIGDRLVDPAEGEGRFEDHFLPRAPACAVSGYILSLVEGVSQIGQYQVVAISLGARDGIDKGHVLAVEQAGATVRDTTSGRSGWFGTDKITLPTEEAGHLMVFHVYEKASYALVMDAVRAMHPGDHLRHPDGDGAAPACTTQTSLSHGRDDHTTPQGQP